MSKNRIVTATFGVSKMAHTRSLYQYDYGTVLQIAGLSLPFAFEVDFANTPDRGQSKTQIGQNSQVSIPDEYLLSGKPIYAWIFLHDSETDGETVYHITIPVRRRTERTDQEPTPVQQDTITQAIAALDAAVEQTGRDVASAGQSASEAAGSAQEAGQSAQNAAQSALEADQSETSAFVYAQRAETAQSSASKSAQDAAGAEVQAGIYADRAEQAAYDGGWMFFNIEDGDLIMERTPKLPVNFYLRDGDLIMEGTT